MLNLIDIWRHYTHLISLCAPNCLCRNIFKEDVDMIGKDTYQPIREYQEIKKKNLKRFLSIKCGHYHILWLFGVSLQERLRLNCKLSWGYFHCLEKQGLRNKEKTHSKTKAAIFTEWTISYWFCFLYSFLLFFLYFFFFCFNVQYSLKAFLSVLVLVGFFLAQLLTDFFSILYVF